MRKGYSRYSSTTEKNIHGTVNAGSTNKSLFHILPATSEQFMSRSSILGRGVRLEEIDEAKIIPLSSIEWERVKLDPISSPDVKNESS